MSAVLGSIISSPAAGMSPLRAAAAVVSDGGGEIVLLRVGRRSMRRDLNQNQTPRATAIPTQSTVASNNFVVAPAFKPLLLSLSLS